MKIETTLSLSEKVLQAIDEHVADPQERSEFIETAVWSFIHRAVREEQAQRDLAILNQYADELNEEATDVLEYQVDW